MVPRVYKARYFADTHLLKALKGRGSGFIWTCLYAAKEALMKGFKWVIGDGEDVMTIKDSWLHMKCDFRVKNNHIYEGRSEKESTLFFPGTKQWTIDMINTNFQEEDAKTILAIHVPQGVVLDRVAWSHSGNNNYDVKARYIVFFEQQRNNIYVPHISSWSKF